jgi:hypothetical protein
VTVPAASTSPSKNVVPPSGVERRGIAQALWWLAPLLVCVLLMAPRIASAHFGLLDDGLTLQQAGRILGGSLGEALSIQAGRLRPLYWLFPTAIFALTGANPVWFFAVNALMLVGLTAGLMALVRLEGGSRLQASLAGLLFALAGPTIEAFYTLSKAEGLQLTLVVSSLVCAAGYGRARSTWGRRAALLGAAIAGLLALLTKETSIVALPMSLAWLLLEWLPARREGQRSRRSARRGSLAAWMVGLPVVVLIVRGQLLATEAMEVHTSGYVFTVSGFISSAIRIAGWMLRDFPYLIPLGLVLLTLWARGGITRRPLLLEGLVWIGAWTAIFLPWPFIAEYYLLPAAAGAAVVAAASVDAVWENRGSLKGWARGGAVALLLLAVIGFLTTVPNNLTSARIQLAVDSANAEALDGISRGLPFGARLIVNLQEHREYFDMIQIFLTQQLGRADLRIEALDPSGIPSLNAAGNQAYVLTPIVEGTPYFTVRVGVGEDDARMWNDALLRSAGDHLELIRQTRREVGRLNIDLPAAICPILRRSVFCAGSRPVMHSGVFVFGWDLYTTPPQ